MKNNDNVKIEEKISQNEKKNPKIKKKKNMTQCCQVKQTNKQTIIPRHHYCATSLTHAPSQII